MRRLLGRAIVAFGALPPLAVVVAAFIGQEVGIWASVLRGAALIGSLLRYLQSTPRPDNVARLTSVDYCSLLSARHAACFGRMTGCQSATGNQAA